MAMRRLVFTLISLASAAAFATTIYKWVDEHGVVHYSDQPHPNAQKLQIQSAQTFSSKDAAVPEPVLSPAADLSAPNEGYRGCVIAAPQDQQTLPNAQSVYLRVQSDPPLHSGDRVFITLDGQNLNGGQPTGLSTNVTPIDRGEHSAQAQIRDASDQVVCQTPTVTFFVTQPNLFSPANQRPPNTNPRPR
jgi:hypothetical protein